MKILLLLLCFWGNLVFATPKHVEVWFLSVDKTSYFRHRNNTFAQARQCQPMGDYCFDPQIGLYKQGEENKVNAVDSSEVEAQKKYDFLELHKGHETELIECDENSGFFDVFCGKAKKISKTNKTKLEVWVDVSSTMKQVDFRGYEKACRRQLLVEGIGLSCPLNQKMKVYSFEEYRKEVGSLDQLCLSNGLNKMSNIIRDLKSSEVDHVLIITDIYEADIEFIQAIESLGKHSFKGLDTPFYASEMKESIARLAGVCK